MIILGSCGEQAHSALFGGASGGGVELRHKTYGMGSRTTDHRFPSSGSGSLSFGLIVVLVFAGSAMPRSAIAQDLDNFKDTGTVEDATAVTLAPTLRIVGAYTKPAPGLRGAGITMIALGGVSFGGGIISFIMTKAALKERDANYKKWQADPASVDENKIRDEDTFAHRTWIAGWALMGSGAGLFMFGNIFAAVAKKQRHRASGNITLEESPVAEMPTAHYRPSFTAGAFSDGKLSALTVRMEW